jgi:hypothetical protein
MKRIDNLLEEENKKNEFLLFDHHLDEKKLY